MAKDTDASSILPRWPQKIVLTKLTAKTMNWDITLWGKITSSHHHSSSLFIEWWMREWLVSDCIRKILTTGPASVESSWISFLKPTGTNMWICFSIKYSRQEETDEPCALLSMIPQVGIDSFTGVCGYQDPVCSVEWRISVSQYVLMITDVTLLSHKSCGIEMFNA